MRPDSNSVPVPSPATRPEVVDELVVGWAFAPRAKLTLARGTLGVVLTSSRQRS